MICRHEHNAAFLGDNAVKGVEQAVKADLVHWFAVHLCNTEAEEWKSSARE